MSTAKLLIYFTLVILIISVWTEKLNTVRLLLEAGADVNAQNEEGYNSLIAASQYGYNGIATRLLSKGAKGP